MKLKWREDERGNLHTYTDKGLTMVRRRGELWSGWVSNSEVDFHLTKHAGEMIERIENCLFPKAEPKELDSGEWFEATMRGDAQVLEQNREASESLTDFVRREMTEFVETYGEGPVYINGTVSTVEIRKQYEMEHSMGVSFEQWWEQKVITAKALLADLKASREEDPTSTIDPLPTQYGEGSVSRLLSGTELFSYHITRKDDQESFGEWYSRQSFTVKQCRDEIAALPPKPDSYSSLQEKDITVTTKCSPEEYKFIMKDGI